MAIRFACVIILTLFGTNSCFAQKVQPAGVGIVLLHGKGGRPSGSIATLGQALSAQSIKVALPEMAWSGRGGKVSNYDVSYEQALSSIDTAISNLRAQGASKIIIAGHSLGANAALAYAALRSKKISGVIAIAPGHMPERMKLPDIQKALTEARQKISAQLGNQRATFPDINSGERFEVSGTYMGWFSYFDPNGTAVMSKNASRLTVPLLYIVGRSDPLSSVGRNYIFDKARPNSKNRYIEVDAGHLDTPDRSTTPILEWLKKL